jgi:cell wall-associated NlpC family hydrolase
MRLSFKAGCLICLAVLLSASCTHAPVRQADGNVPTIGEKAALTAVSMIGRPYKYKGNTPAGFDCSGLVQYSYLAAGMEDLPHGTKALLGLTRSIGKDMQTGDLLFFNERGKKYSHVGIYLENGTFVHAPGTGGQVKTESLDDPYWQSSFVESRRFMEPPEVTR